MSKRRFDRPITELPGVSKYRFGRLKRLDLWTEGDLLRYFPRAYENWSNRRTIAELPENVDVAIEAEVITVPNLNRRGRQSTLRATLADETGRLQAVWFNQPYYQNQLVPGERYLFYGRARRYRGNLNFQNPRFQKLDDNGDVFGMLPIYPSTQGIQQGFLRSLTKLALEDLGEQIPEALPLEIRRQAGLAAVRYAYEKIHYPGSDRELHVARERLAFEELFLTRLGLRLLRAEREAEQDQGLVQELDEAAQKVFHQAIADLPFDLTRAQQRALGTVMEDLQRSRPMNRLIQGDVGSGKTAVAAMAMLHAILTGKQAVMMAPTSVLAQQHYQSMKKLLPGLPEESIALLTGQTKTAERRELLARLSRGDIKLLIGTHALIEERVRFQSLGLTVTDEQHRFGVNQRIRLSTEKGETPPLFEMDDPQDDQPRPHVLVMSATPIPRSLALVLYGDLDISVIDELPAGRLPIDTYTARSKDMDRVYRLMRKQIAEGGQVYVVTALVDEQEEVSETQLPLQSATETYELYRKNIFPDLEVGLLHGQMKAKDKDEAMAKFQSGETKILVSTTVIEVGVDNPRANLMVILNAERFGLAQLHQLRGRIGRGDLKSYCVLVSDSEEDLARERMTALCRHRDGFEIAEIDLKLRGPGDFFGTRQHGIPAFRIANLYEDQRLLTKASSAVEDLLNGKIQLTGTERAELDAGLKMHFGERGMNPGL